ncbi:MAG TPA: glycosyltransferase [Pyrinomonadaceae bacterium]|jgi:ubiquinone/menaquinone biosynthesis C-methylase UbiE
MNVDEVKESAELIPPGFVLAAGTGRADPSFLRYRDERVAHWDAVADWMTQHPARGGAYRRRLVEVYRYFVPAGARVLEIGCAQGDLLAALRPARGVGVDFSARMIARARAKHPDLRFVHADAHALDLEAEPFDFIILSDVANDLWDVQAVCQQLARFADSRTRVVLNFSNRLWRWPLTAARRLGLARPNLRQSWLTVADLTMLLDLAGFEVIRHRREALLPLPLGPVAKFANRYAARFWPASALTATHFLVARPVKQEPPTREPVVSVIIPARDEAGNIADIFARMPEMGAGTEMVFVEGGSRDNTYGTVEQLIAAHPERRCQLHRQKGRGKVDAVRLGFERARGDVLMIFDADLTVPPEDMPRLLEMLTTGRADFVNPTRLVYPMEGEAMRFFNLVGNKFFGLVFSWLLERPFKDVLCGTKVLWRADYERIAANRHYFGDFDPFGEFDLLFGAAKLNLKIEDVPVRHRRRHYGTTKIPRWRGGVMLLRMAASAARRIKFI